MYTLRTATQNILVYDFVYTLLCIVHFYGKEASFKRLNTTLFIETSVACNIVQLVQK